MRTTMTLAAAVLALTLAACDQSQQQTSAPASDPAPAAMPMPGQAPAASTGVYTTTGQIASVAPDSVTINHQPVAALNWPAMTMTFKAPDTAMTAGLQQGAAVEFSFRQQGNDYVLTDVKRR